MDDPGDGPDIAGMFRSALGGRQSRRRGRRRRQGDRQRRRPGADSRRRAIRFEAHRGAAGGQPREPAAAAVGRQRLHAVQLCLRAARCGPARGSRLRRRHRARQRARRMYLRARGYALRGLEVRHPGFGANCTPIPPPPRTPCRRRTCPGCTGRGILGRRDQPGQGRPGADRRSARGRCAGGACRGARPGFRCRSAADLPDHL